MGCLFDGRVYVCAQASKVNVEEKRQYIYIVIKNIDEFSVLHCVYSNTYIQIWNTYVCLSMKTINQKVNLCRCACLVFAI